MRYSIDEMRKTINIKCTKEEKKEIQKKILMIPCIEHYDTNFIIQDDTTNQ